MLYVVTITLDNTTSNYLTLNSASVNGENMFMNDDAYTVYPKTTSTIVLEAITDGWTTYNISESALLKIAWTFRDNQYTLDPSWQGTNQYTLTYGEPSISTKDQTEYCAFSVIFAEPT